MHSDRKSVCLHIWPDSACLPKSWISWKTGSARRSARNEEPLNMGASLTMILPKQARYSFRISCRIIIRFARYGRSAGHHCNCCGIVSKQTSPTVPRWRPSSGIVVSYSDTPTSLRLLQRSLRSVSSSCTCSKKTKSNNRRKRRSRW
jgi:hypothetical protein